MQKVSVRLNDFRLCSIYCFLCAACLVVAVYGRALDNSFSPQTSLEVAGALVAPGQTAVSTFHMHFSLQVS